MLSLSKREPRASFHESLRLWSWICRLRVGGIAGSRIGGRRGWNRYFPGGGIHVHHLRLPARDELLHLGVEAERRPQRLCLAAQQVCELPAVAHLVIGQVDARMQRSLKIQARLDHGALARIQHRSPVVCLNGECTQS